MASRARLASIGTLISSLSTQIMLNLSVFAHLYHAYASVMKFCAQFIKTETLNPLKNPPNPTAETLTLEKSPNLRNPNPKDLKKRVGDLPKGPSRPPPSPWLPP
jgi:hypothetical protein